jgi:hypothetical protein
VPDSHLERALTNIVINGSTRNAKEQGQLVPTIEQVVERVPEAELGSTRFSSSSARIHRWSSAITGALSLEDPDR